MHQAVGCRPLTAKVFVQFPAIPCESDCETSFLPALGFLCQYYSTDADILHIYSVVCHRRYIIWAIDSVVSSMLNTKD